MNFDDHWDVKIIRHLTISIPKFQGVKIRGEVFLKLMRPQDSQSAIVG